MPLGPYNKIGPLFETRHFSEVKDPCIVHDGLLWHIFGTGVSKDGKGLRIAHATAENIEGPWTEIEPATLSENIGPHAGAPGVIFDPSDRHFHMAVQEDFTSIGGKILYFVSSDGNFFSKVSTLLDPVQGSSEAGLYDPHFCILKGEKYLVYAGMSGIIDHGKPYIPQPDIYLAKSTTGLWVGPWQRIGKILDHDDIKDHHNKRTHHDYEWGIEGPQLIELPQGKILLNATCFLEVGTRGTRQRVFFAVSDSPTGPFKTHGPVITTNLSPWELGENGHATAIIIGETLYLFYQARKSGDAWKYGIALFDIKDIA